MTTTLRPLGPEEHDEGGGRTRAYAVCVNSRRVGEIVLGAARSGGVTVGTLSELRVDEADRHRGRGTVAALAAEEVLRQWGCVQAEAAVPGEADAALALAQALGYRPRSVNMAKRLPAEAPALPPGCAAHPLTGAEFDAWSARQREDYVRAWVEQGMSEEQARAKAEHGYRWFLPEGEHTPGAVLRVLTAGGTRVGTLWVTLRGPDRPDQAWVSDVRVEEEHRGRGHGRTLMLLAEAECLAAGVPELGLHVFADNTPAVRLYESLGYRATRHYLIKPLT